APVRGRRLTRPPSVPTISLIDETKPEHGPAGVSAMRLAHDDVGQGPVVVLLHGFPLDRTMWSGQAAALRSSYRLILPDLRGHGASDAPEGMYTMDVMADDVVALLDEL